MASFASLFSLHRPSATELCGEEKHSPEQMPEQTSPEHGGEPRLLQLPDEVLHEIFFLLDLSSLTRCFRVSVSSDGILTVQALQVDQYPPQLLCWPKVAAHSLSQRALLEPRSHHGARGSAKPDAHDVWRAVVEAA